MRFRIGQFLALLVGVGLALEEGNPHGRVLAVRSEAWHGKLTKRAEYMLTLYHDLTIRVEETEFNRGEAPARRVWDGVLDVSSGVVRMKHEASGDTREWLFCRGSPFSVLIIDQYTFVRLWKPER